jgi:hypothetical protein
MKRAGYLKHDKPGTSAEAGWNSFATDLGPAFYALCQSDPELKVLIIAPPQLLKIDRAPGGTSTVDWKKSRAVNSVESFYAVIKDIRNNLFHGEKQVHSARDGELLAAAQRVLDMSWETAAADKANPKLVRFCDAFRFD